MPETSISDSQLSIIKAAEKLFIANGFQSTSTNEIASLAGVSKALLFHHFKSKERIWIALKEYLLGKLLEKQESSFKGENTFEILENVIRNKDISNKKTLHFLTLNHWELLEGTIHHHFPDKVFSSKLADLIEKGKTKGDIRTDISTESIISMYYSLTNHFPLIVNSISDRFEKNKSELSDRYYNDLIKIFFQGLSPQPV